MNGLINLAGKGCMYHLLNYVDESTFAQLVEIIKRNTDHPAVMH